MKLLELRVKHEWRGTSEELLEDLGEEVSDDVRHSKAWPKAPNALSRRLNRLAPMLREAGIELSEDEVGHNKTKVKILRKIDQGGEEGSQGGGSSDERPASDGGILRGRLLRRTKESMRMPPSTSTSARTKRRGENSLATSSSEVEADLWRTLLSRRAPKGPAFFFREMLILGQSELSCLS